MSDCQNKPWVLRADVKLSRRAVLQRSLNSMGLLTTGSMLAGCNLFDDSDDSVGSGAPAMVSNIANIGPLGVTPDENGFLLPEGFSSRMLLPLIDACATSPSNFFSTLKLTFAAASI